MSEKNIMLPFADKLFKARFLERPNRFILRCILEELREIDFAERDFLKTDIPKIDFINTDFPETQQIAPVIDAHLPDPGRLKELLIPGCEVLLRRASGLKRKTEWSAVLCRIPDGEGFVSLDSTLPNRLIGKALAQGALMELAGWSLHKAEYARDHSRWDFLLIGADGRKLFLEVKSVTLVENGVGLFPDAVTARGVKHLRELAEIAREKESAAAVLFVGQREDIKVIRPAAAIDPVFAVGLASAAQAGVRILGRKCLVSTAGITLGEQVPVEY